MTKEPICKCFAHVVVGTAVHAFSAVPRASAAAISFLLAASLSSAASNSAPVTFVSVLGDDKETPCTCTDPCRTFARAVSLTQAGGEVVALDSGAYDAFTIDKAVSIIAAPGEHAVIWTSGTAITVAAGASDVVVVRGLALADRARVASGATRRQLG